MRLAGPIAAAALLLGAPVLAPESAPARAQVGARRPAPPAGQQTPPAPQPGVVQVLPPEPLLPNSLGLLERDFQMMRATSPNPNGFLHGRWNPRFQVVTPPVQVTPVPGGYPIYGGYYNPYYPYGYGYAGYGYPGSVVQREVIIIHGGQGQNGQGQGRYGAGAPQYGQGAPQPGAGQGRGGAALQAPARPEAAPDAKPAPGEDFYLRGGGEESLTDALDDLRKAWLNGDFGRLQARFQADGKVRVYLKGQYRYSVEGREFTAMLKDALGRIDTLAFELERPTSREAGKVLVTGKHTFLDGEKNRQTTYVSYGLERRAGRWMIVEAGSSPTPVAGHEG